MKKIVYTLNGVLHVVTPAINTYPDPEKITDGEAIERALRKLPAGASNPRIVEANEVPRDRTYRGAWIDTGSAVTHDMEKCRQIHRDNLRAIRRSRLVYLDGEWMKATATGNLAAATEVEKKRQQLRDAPQYEAIDLASTPEELKLAIPQCLA